MNPVLDSLYAQRTALLDEIDTIARAVADGDGRDLSDTESNVIDRARGRIDSELDPQIETWESIERTRAAHETRAPVVYPSASAPTSFDESGSEMVYRSFAQYARDVLITRYDQIAQRAGGSPARQAAEERISRAVAHTLTSDIPGLLPPTYLSTLVQLIDKSRPIVQASRQVPLASGKLSYPSVTQKPIVGKQAPEKSELPSATMTVAFVDVVADTYGGSGNLSWQAINWSTPDALSLWFDLAAEAYAVQTEAAAGTVLGASAGGPVVPTDDLAGWMAGIAEAAGIIYTNTHRRADTIFADVTSGYELIGMVSNASPVFLPGGSFSLASGSGSVAGLQLVISPGLPLNTTIVGVSSQLLCAESPGAPVELRAVEPAIGGMEVGVIGAFVAKVVQANAFLKLTPPA